MNNRKIETILGWIVFTIALVTYALTMERTGSLWDCGEFLSCTYKLQVAHPPGAPFFMMVGKVFSLLAMGDTTKVAMFINLLSAVSGAFCSYFFFHSAVILIRLIGNISFEESSVKTNLALGASFIGALAATFLDSMWFNNIEGEVYAFSIFFTTFNVWAVLRWYESKSERADFWLLLVAVCTGMSIGVHLLSLLVFPLMTILFYYKKFESKSFKGLFLAFIAGVALIFAMMKVILSMTSSFLGKLDLLFVNTFGLPFYSGTLFGIGFIIFLFYFLLKKSSENRKFLKWNEEKIKISLNTFVLFFAFLFMGYTSYFMVVIRAKANLPINMNVPDNFLTLKSYIDREQYGDRPLLFGPHYYDAQEVESYIDKSDIYVINKETKKYEHVGVNKGYKYPERVKKFLPRVSHEDENKKSFYRSWINPKYNVVDRSNGEVVQTFERDQLEQAEQTAAQMNGNMGQQFVVKDRITFFENIWFMLKYQYGFMYFRYLMWNTAGRTDDMQGRVTNDYGRWTTGFSFLDNFLGDTWGNVYLDQSKKPHDSTNRSHNNFYMIPFLLCVLGMYYNYKKDRWMFFALLLLFITMGLLQIFQNNSPPVEPRERDYALAPSFWTFVLWLPLGILYLFEKLKSKLSEKMALVTSLMIGLAAPVLMGTQGWDDHDRGNRSTTLAFAKNMLEACPPNAILFCYGDNDTYPLWYAQEIENIRPDIRVINTSLIEGDAYISQLRLPMNESKAIKLSIMQDKIKGDKRQFFRLNQNGAAADSMPLKDVIEFMMSDDPAAKVSYNPNYPAENYLPTTNVYFDIDPAKAIQSGFLVPKDKAANVPSRIHLQLPSSLSRGSLLQLDVILNNMYDRPVCFASSNPSVAGLGLKNYLMSQGMLIMFSPVGSPDINGMEAIDAERVYNHIFKYDFGKVKENDILLDEHTLISFNGGMKPAIANLAMYYAVNNQPEKVDKLLNHLYTNIPPSKLPYNYVDLPALQAASISKNQKYIKQISEGMYNHCTKNLDWITGPNNAKKSKVAQEELRLYLGSLNGMQEILTRAGDTAMAGKIQQKMNQYNMVLN
jgi:hypothetical protein